MGHERFASFSKCDRRSSMDAPISHEFPSNWRNMGTELVIRNARSPRRSPDCTGSIPFTAFDHGSVWESLNDAPAAFPSAEPAYPAPPKPTVLSTISGNRKSSLFDYDLNSDLKVNGVPQYVPIDSSLTDLEVPGSTEVISVSRASSLTPAGTSIDPGVDRFSIVLTSAFNHVLRSSNTVVMPRACCRRYFTCPWGRCDFVRLSRFDK